LTKQVAMQHFSKQSSFLLTVLFIRFPVVEAWSETYS
jgi:hypothetical protein